MPGSRRRLPGTARASSAIAYQRVSDRYRTRAVRDACTRVSHGDIGYRDIGETYLQRPFDGRRFVDDVCPPPHRGKREAVPATAAVDRHGVLGDGHDRLPGICRQYGCLALVPDL